MHRHQRDPQCALTTQCGKSVEGTSIVSNYNLDGLLPCPIRTWLSDSSLSISPKFASKFNASLPGPRGSNFIINSIHISLTLETRAPKIMKLFSRPRSSAYCSASLRWSAYGGGLATAIAFSTVCWSQDSNADNAKGSIGSSATLEWLQTKPSQRPKSMPESTTTKSDSNGISVADPRDKLCSLSPQPTPAFKYRFWPSRLDMRPGTAQTHFYRAILQRSFVSQGLPKERRDQSAARA